MMVWKVYESKQTKYLIFSIKKILGKKKKSHFKIQQNNNKLLVIILRKYLIKENLFQNKFIFLISEIFFSWIHLLFNLIYFTFKKMLNIDFLHM